MRTTLIIPDTLYERAKEAAKKEGCTISNFLTEAIELCLLKRDQTVRSDRALYRVKSRSMGVARVDVSNREELVRAMPSSCVNMA